MDIFLFPILLQPARNSGKSTFINYVIGKDIQKTGVAPTDDAFTVVIPGHTEADQDGPSVSS